MLQRNSVLKTIGFSQRQERESLEKRLTMRNFANRELVPQVIAHRSWVFNRTKNRETWAVQRLEI